MAVAKIIGYVVAIIGVILVALGAIPALRTALKFIPATISSGMLMIVGVVIVILGIIPIFRSSGSAKQAAEVPIYHGKEVVGFRRMSK